MRRFRALVLLCLALLLTFTHSPSAATADPTPLARQSDAGFALGTHTSYRFVPERAVVEVTVEIDVANQTAPVAGPGYVTNTVLPEFGVPVLAGATSFVATVEGGRSLSVRTKPATVDLLTFAIIDLVPDLAYPDAVTVNLSYEIPSAPPRSASLARINPAFATFPIFADGDPGKSSVEVVVPEGFEIEMVGDQLVAADGRDETVYVADAIAEPLSFSSFIVLSDNGRLVTRTVAVGDRSVNVRAWPDDAEWADFVADQVTGRIPVFEEVLGLPWPAGDGFEIIETLSPYLYGYAGWYTPNESSIEIGDELDPDVILHELAHLWFNNDLFQGRWINEALAEEFASVVREKVDGVVRDPDPVDKASPGFLELNTWENPVLQDELSADQEKYGYSASWFVMDRIGDEIGSDKLAEVVRAAANGTISYLGDPEPETVEGVADWRRFLDLVVERGGSEAAPGVFAEYVLTAEEQAELEARAASRELYAHIADDDWSPPYEVRLLLTDWDFVAADTAITTAVDLLAIRDELAANGQDLDLSGLEPVYETADDVALLIRVFDQAEAAGGSIADADAAVAAAFAPARFVADLGHGPSDDLLSARDAFARGSYSEATRLAERATDAAESATLVAVVRIAALLALLMVAGVSVVVVRKQSRNTRSAGPPARV